MNLHAPLHWKCLDFISDLHLHESEPATFEAWQAYMHNTPADALFILGDLFEVWVGDDTLQQPCPFELKCVEVLRQTSKRVALFIMQGNRDFLMGQALMNACGATLLPDPTSLIFSGQNWQLSHGDALCLEDTSYQEFRQTVRSDFWQQSFLQKPFEERQHIARGIRQQSEARKKQGSVYADVDTQAATTLLLQNGSTTLIHGHTHRPANHKLGTSMRRLVLSDWDMSASPPRAEVLRLCLQDNGQTVEQRLPAAPAEN